MKLSEVEEALRTSWQRMCVETNLVDGGLAATLVERYARAEALHFALLLLEDVRKHLVSGEVANRAQTVRLIDSAAATAVETVGALVGHAHLWRAPYADEARVPTS